MKKNRINAFTLVEMLIVIVIIGILIAALLPRMQAAQGRARDVSRKTALSQIQSAIVVSQGDKGAWPGMEGNKGDITYEARQGIDVKDIKTELGAAGLNGVPEDPLLAKVDGLGTTDSDSASEDGQYRYMVLPRNGTPAGGFILMAKTEVEGGSNWVVCGGENDDINKGKITPQTSATVAGNATDLKKIVPCATLSLDKSTENAKCGRVATTDDDDDDDDTPSVNDVCYYNNDSQLRYIITY